MKQDCIWLVCTSTAYILNLYNMYNANKWDVHVMTVGVWQKVLLRDQKSPHVKEKICFVLKKTDLCTEFCVWTVVVFLFNCKYGALNIMWKQ